MTTQDKEIIFTGKIENYETIPKQKAHAFSALLLVQVHDSSIEAGMIDKWVGRKVNITFKEIEQ